jgi:hypothetical protein
VISTHSFELFDFDEVLQALANGADRVAKIRSLVAGHDDLPIIFRSTKRCVEGKGLPLVPALEEGASKGAAE